MDRPVWVKVFLLKVCLPVCTKSEIDLLVASSVHRIQEFRGKLWDHTYTSAFYNDTHDVESGGSPLILCTHSWCGRMDPMVLFYYIIKRESFHHETHGSLRLWVDPLESLLSLIQPCLTHSGRTFLVRFIEAFFQASSPCVIIRQVKLNLGISWVQKVTFLPFSLHNKSSHSCSLVGIFQTMPGFSFSFFSPPFPFFSVL